ncbi:MAG: hypothetical protein BZY88_12075 [SAR202 cluster bacterium Io17-Chloro-G9]|nr:MAG: hypothetical protein BZY88_12075 [SAR202 cluster bacterium Io17-Chloro-G9]
MLNGQHPGLVQGDISQGLPGRVELELFFFFFLFFLGHRGAKSLLCEARDSAYGPQSANLSWLELFVSRVRFKPSAFIT